MIKIYGRRGSPALLSLMCIPLIGCAAQQVPQAEHVDTKSTVKAAEVAGAQEVPRASLYLKMAQDGVKDAEALMAEEKYDEARQELERAKIDADLALSLTREEEIRQEAEEEKQRLKELEGALFSKTTNERQG